jgi:prolyl-tRNA synthetase
VVLDDRDADTTPGFRLRDAALVGYPYMAVLGRAFAERGLVELHTRNGRSSALVALDAVLPWLRDALAPPALS